MRSDPTRIEGEINPTSMRKELDTTCIRGIMRSDPYTERNLLIQITCQRKDNKTRGLEITLKKWITLNAFGSKSLSALSDARESKPSGSLQ